MKVGNKKSIAAHLQSMEWWEKNTAFEQLLQFKKLETTVPFGKMCISIKIFCIKYYLKI